VRFSEAVRAHRRRLGLTQEELAAATGISSRHLRDMEAGRIVRPRPSTVRLLADAFTLRGADRDAFHRSAAVDDRPDPALPAGPAQLPLDVHGFSGRRPELRRLDSLLRANADQPTAVVVTALSGTAGVGKTALAVHWAHRVADRFPDGQLHVNLRGFDPGGTPLAPFDALRHLLDGLHVPPARVPADLDARTGLYRSLVAGKRILVLLDNARDAEQVRPLLPGAPGCLAVVTSRNELTSLAVSEGAHPIALDLPTADEARELLARRLGPDRVTAEPAAVDEIVAACARLPLALAIVAARAASRPRTPLTALAAQLRDAGSTLGPFASTDQTIDIRTVFSWSYRTLRPGAARLFRLVGLAPGPDIGRPAAASLTGLPAAQADEALTELVDAHLLTEHAPGRYAFHDLLRAYAAELCHALDDEADRRTALRRLLDHYLHTAIGAAMLVNEHRDRIGAEPPATTVKPEELADAEQALAWFTAEHAGLTASIRLSAELGLEDHAWWLAWSLADFLERRGHWHDWVAGWQTALAATRRGDNGPQRAHAHHSLASAHTRLGRYDEAHRHLELALDIYTRLGDTVGQAHTHNNMALNYEQQGRPAPALEQSELSLALYRVAGHEEGQARALNNIGWCLGLLDEHERALDSCRQALDLNERIGHRHGQAITWDSLGYIHHRLGRPEEAIAAYRRSAELFHDLGDRYNESETLTHIGDAYRGVGDLAGARASWQAALSILDELNHPEAVAVRDRLHRLTA
jgi:tetratricopeptide (TPR) repeat protein/transcriptional regulator with XRE-family HTH domain